MKVAGINTKTKQKLKIQMPATLSVLIVYMVINCGLIK